MKKILLIIFSSLLLFSCKSGQIKTTDEDAIIIKIVQINDVYEIDPINNGKNGGLARVAWIRDSVQQRFPNTYFFLAGDFLNPSLLGTIKVDGERLQGKQMVEVLNASGLDLTVFGNHEFDVKEADLQKRLNESNFDWIGANVLQVNKDGERPFQIHNNHGNRVSDYKIYTARNARGDEVKFGVFGVVIPSNPKPFVKYNDIFDESVRAYNELANQTDFVLGLTHVSIDQDKKIAGLLPNLPLIMGGHEHFNMIEKAGNTVITKADANVVSLYLHTLTYRKGKLKLESELIKVTDRIPNASQPQKVVEKWIGVLDENLSTIVDNPNEVIYTTSEYLDGTDVGSRSRQTNLGKMITEAMSRAFEEEPEAVITNGGGIRIDDRLTGELTSKDVFRILPYGGNVYKVDMTGQLLKQVLTFGEEATGTGAYLQRHNISKDPNGMWQVRGSNIKDDQIYTIGLNDFLMEGLDIPFLTPQNPGIRQIQKPSDNQLAADMRKCLIAYMKSL